MSNWEEIKTNKKQNPKNNIHSSLKLLSDGINFQCLNGTCKKNDCNHNFPEKMSNYIKNPIYIKEIGELLKKENLKFGNYSPIYTTCSQINGECINCKEGRYQFLSYKNDKIYYCYPSLDSLKTKITINLHIDVIYEQKGNNYDLSFKILNVDYDIPEPNDVFNNKINEINEINQTSNLEELNNTKINDLTNNKELDTANNYWKDNYDKLATKYNQEKNAENVNKEIMKNKMEKLSQETRELRKQIEELKYNINKKNKIIETVGMHKKIYDMMMNVNTVITNQILETDYGEYIYVE